MKVIEGQRGKHCDEDEYLTYTHKLCGKCDTAKPVTDFYRRATKTRRGWSWSTYCAECSREGYRTYALADRGKRNRRLREWRQRNPGAALANEQRKRLRFKYDISVEDRDSMFEQQGHCCAICDTKGPLVIDHDHATGAVREGLCNRCNIVLGRVEADRTYAEKVALGLAMVNYLDRHQAPELDQPCHGDVLLALANPCPDCTCPDHDAPRHCPEHGPPQAHPMDVCAHGDDDA